MSDRERIRRPEPARTEPVRNITTAFRNWDSGPSAPGAAPPGGDPFTRLGDDPVSRAVRASCEVVERAVRRGFGLGDPASAGAPGRPPWMAFGGAGAGAAGPWSAWTTGQWVDAMSGAFAQWAQWFDAWTAMARSPAGESGWPAPPTRRASDPGPTSAAPGASPASATAASVAPAAPRITVELRSARAVTVELDLTTAPGPGTALEVPGLLAPASAGAPPITDVAVALGAGGVTVALGSLDQHPAGIYAGAVLSAGRALGTLTVRLA